MSPSELLSAASAAARPVVGMCRRLHLHRENRRLEAALKVNYQKMNALLSNIHFDNKCAAELCERYLKSPTLQMRRVEDRKVLQQLCEERDSLLRQLRSRRAE